MNLSRTLAVLALIPLGLAGCAGTEDASQDPLDYLEFSASVLDDARAAGASEAQLAILEDAAETGVISFEDASAANEATITCLLDAGFNASSRPYEAVPGWTVPGFVAGRPSDMSEAQGDAVLADCERLESYFVNMMYQTQPAAEEAKWAQFEQLKPQVIECLEDAGVTVPEDATNDELADLALDLAFADTSAVPVDCLHEVGINSL